ncbi:hypothetical protein ACF07Y_39100 [Streptomyces sp. NPDC016566]|uniref:hypothetical protein n=1 Tax=Streptomyces sp. NPDC016566 TaxID=3364967 RepID=UPI0036F81D32
MMRTLTAFFEFFLMLWALIMVLTSGVLLVSYGGPSIELAKALAVLAVLITLIMLTERLTTGHWWRWSRR